MRRPARSERRRRRRHAGAAAAGRSRARDDAGGRAATVGLGRGFRRRVRVVGIFRGGLGEARRAVPAPTLRQDPVAARVGRPGVVRATLQRVRHLFAAAPTSANRGGGGESRGVDTRGSTSRARVRRSWRSAREGVARRAPSLHPGASRARHRARPAPRVAGAREGRRARRVAGRRESRARSLPRRGAGAVPRLAGSHVDAPRGADARGAGNRVRLCRRAETGVQGGGGERRGLGGCSGAGIR
mmetsp:Transcript_548/g.2375  ORF Transcript_548/g.2375 Transcript_548/m.2375 type:complete len:243 (-) Transcript_548:61-789(-)